MGNENIQAIPPADSVGANKSQGGGDVAMGGGDVVVVGGGNELSEDALNADTSQDIYCFKYYGSPAAKGYAVGGFARGGVYMSNLFLGTALIYHASNEAGCINENDEIIDNCEGKVHGLDPTTLFANIAFVSGILVAFFLPIIGAIIDYTEHRKTVGIVVAFLLTAIQAVQISTNENNWFIMAILQAFVGFLFQVQLLTMFSYLPEIAKSVGPTIMNGLSTNFFSIQFGNECVYIVLVIAVSSVLNFSTAQTARLSQAISMLWLGPSFVWAWMLLPKEPPRHALPHGHFLLAEGFRQNWRTAKSINKHYKSGLRWFLLAIMFGEAGTSALVPLVVTFLTSELDMDSSQIGAFFFIALFSAIPGAYLGSFVTRRTNPRNSMILSLIYSGVTTLLAVLLLSPERSSIVYIFAFLWGSGVGWYVPTEVVFFSLCLPPGQDAELTGFYFYCSLIITWLPALVFSILVESGVKKNYGILSNNIFMLIAIGFLLCVKPWPKVLEEAQINKCIPLNEQLLRSTTTSRGSENNISEPDEEEQKQQQQDDDDEAKKQSQSTSTTSITSA